MSRPPFPPDYRTSGVLLHALTIAPLQDVLSLGRGARMNVPGRAQGNWRWRCTEPALAGPAFEWLRELTTTSGRSITCSAEVTR